jgi:CheY-like chemotaxis protein/signal transduction histidine kinase/CHASE3 domain sensor protein
MKLKTQMLSGFFLIFIMIALITGVNYQRITSLIETANWVSHTHVVISEAELIQKLMVDMETGQRGFLITGKEQFLEPFNSGKSNYLKTHSGLKQLVSDNPAQVIRLMEIDLLINRWLDVAAIPEMEIRRDVNKGKASMEDVSAVIISENGKNIIDELRIKLEEFIGVEEELLAIRSEESEKAASWSLFISITACLLSIMLGIVVMIVISRDIMRKVGGEPSDILEITENIASGELDVELEDEKRTATGVYAAVINMLESFVTNRNVIESSLKVQKGVMDISETMIGKTSMHEFGITLLKQLMKITKANMSTFYILNEATSEYEHFVSIGTNEELLKPFNAENPEGEFGNAISEKSIYYLQDIPEDTIFKFKTIAGDLVPKEIITIPVLIENSVLALISLVNTYKFNVESYEVLKQTWQTINTSYSSLLSNERSRVLAESLTKTNQQLEAQSEELQEQAEELQEQTVELQRSSEELQEQNIELETQRTQVEEASRLKSEFLSNMSHELRTPLNSINALSQVLIMQAKNKLSDDENNYLEIIERNGKQLLSLINDILDLSKIEAGKMDILPQAVSIDSLLTVIKENVQTLAENKGISINLNLVDNLPKVETDESKLHQVLLNIISNAVKFTEKGSVSISTTQEKEYIYIDVKDTGIGVSEKMLPHIFDEFRQADGSSSRQYEGTGLGLTIANKLITILGGDIKVKSKLGKGSIFTITVPVKWHQGISGDEVFSSDKTSSQFAENTILVVDDDPEIVKGISEYLNENGYKTIIATSGEEALELAEKYQPFAITLDVIMPEMDGWEVLQKLKTNTKTKNIPVIVVTVSDDKDTGFALGAVGYINKPVDKNLLISEIKKLNKTPDSVMIVDDNDFELKLMAEIIEAENINTILAHGGKESIKLLEEKVPDILVLDLMMPDMDGFQVLEKIRKSPKTKNLPVVIVTAKDITQEDKIKLSGKISTLIAKSDTTPQDLFKEIKRIIKELEKSQKDSASVKNTHGTSILLVEDNKDAIIQMKSILEREDFIVDVANGGQEALDYINHTIPDGIILDLMMPEVNGFEVLDKIRSAESTKNIPILILTAKDLTREDLSKLNTNNIKQLIQKGNIDINGLLTNVRLMLGNEPKILEEDEKVKKSFGKENEKMREGENEIPITIGMRKEDVEKKRTDQKKDPDLPNVLIVEDNPDNMTTIKAILQNKYNITEAFDGEQGLELVQSQIPDMILLDMSLPKMDGEEIVKILKGNKETERIPVIAVTARVMKGDEEIFLKAGCDDFVAKPIEPNELNEKINKLLNK